MQDLESQRTSSDEKTLTGPVDPPSITDSNKTDAAPQPAEDGEESKAEESASTAELYPLTDLDKSIVGWDGQDDPANPQNFSETRKWALLALMSSMTLISPLASSMFAPAASNAAAEWKVTNETLLSFSVTIFLMGYVVGTLFLAPLSEIYGRRIVLSCANWFFVAWQIGCALSPNISALIIFRLLAGIGGAGSITLGAGVIADLFPLRERAKATALWSMGPLLGPVAGPICGGFIGETVGWRWVFWVLLIAAGSLAAGIEVLNRETYARVLIQWKTRKMAKELGRDDLRSGYETGEQHRPSQVLIQGLKRPVVLFYKSPIVFLLSIYMSLVYGLLYLFFTTIPTVFETQYGFSPGLAGLAYLGIGAGFFLAVLIVGLTNDRIVSKLMERNGGKYEPEMRLPMMIFFAAVAPISFFWYGWSADKHVHWIVPIIGMFPYGLAMMGLFVPTQTYVIDSYQMYAASAGACLTATRSLFGALLPLAGPQMFKALGLGWGNSLLGFLALAFVPIPIFFTRYGKVIREKYPVDLDKY
ncbi:MFS multidrug transporter, putative [Talaromyces stipitatus ATCC 10500]|uniref:MFS multidrug transporter, putative n=1 Tax=Talaromyces stipitatus (strain ATCC 10500 / CBS 375.48 / QM 6759 / NRRL 1006) TaxID=441959 RepID=B8MPE0_TALSN|nr:MFS multidrug transporter, putative [Talaromyces stipitatus ATCC 10500]EED14379.1 MFS multidrug transporter, putative [Talaromyces stipitatus ATCC 10500]